jgi:hypothetical protein
MTMEKQRLAAADAGSADWRAWGPYVAERAWGTVREDYSPDGDAWGFFPHDHARSRTYRWNEDGMAGVCDEGQTWCLALALWNGADPFLKERMFGLAGPQGNHGEDVKDYWWYVDATPTHSWMSWRYHYPQRAFPYDDLVATNAARTRDDEEYELLDTGVFDDDRYWVVDVDYAKADVHDLLMRVRVTNMGPDEATLHVLPTFWFRNVWAWGLPGKDDVPVITSATGRLVAAFGDTVWSLTHDDSGTPLFCDNETNSERIWGTAGRSSYPKDGINDHVVYGAATVNPDQHGTKSAVHHVLTVRPGDTQEVRVRLTADRDAGDLGASFDEVMTARQAEADAFYVALTPEAVTADAALVLRQALAGMLWSKQFYHYDVARWLDGDPAGPEPPPQRRNGRNAGWRQLNNHDVITMPDKWEYPWYAAWDLAVHCVALAHVDPTFAKEQLLLMTREWYMHPNGQLPAYEWEFGDVNPPVHAWATLRVFHVDGSQDFEFLERAFHKLLLNFTWWVNRKDADGNNVFEGGFLGLDNIGAFDRSAGVPAGGRLEQSDGTAWMAMFCLNMWEIALVLAVHDDAYEDMATKFFEHFALIASAAQRLWDEQDGFFYDVLQGSDGLRAILRVRSVVGLLPLAATTTLGMQAIERMPYFSGHMRWFVVNKPELCTVVSAEQERDGGLGRLLSVADEAKLRRLVTRMLDEDEFLSPFGLRSMSRFHRDHPFTVDLGGTYASVDYEPGESRSGLFGGNSNWRGPVWIPMNVMLIRALLQFHGYYGDSFKVECPTGSGNQMTLFEVAKDISDRLLSIFKLDAEGRPPVFRCTERFQQ